LKRTISVSTLFILIGIFICSVFVRLPNLNRPLSKHHEFVTAISLRVLDIWHQEGATKYNFNPVMNYPGKANKHINNWASTTGQMVDELGNYYYVSHPPFAYILPHLVFKVLHIKPSVLTIQIFHLAINFISALFIYLIICLLGQQKPFLKTYWSGVVGFSIYLFSQGVLWFQMNTYMSDMLVHLFFILNVYIILKLIIRKRFFSPKYLVWHAVILFLMIYTSWLGIFFAFSVFLYSLLKLRKTKVFIPLNLITIFISIAAISLFTYQYSLINGFDSYLDQMMNRMDERGSLVSGGGITTSLKGFAIGIIHVLKGYLTSYFPLFLLLVSFVYLTITKAKLRIVFTKNGYRFLWLSTLPVVLLHIFLLNYSGHDFVSLYGSLFLSVLVAILYDKLKYANTLTIFKLRLGIGIVLVFSLASYYYVNRPGSYSLYGDYYASSMDLAAQISKTSEAEEVIFVIGERSIDPQIIYYAHRNILKVKDEEEALSFLEKHQLNSGIIYYYAGNSSAEFSEIQRIQRN
jgi:hypothetical protein